MMSFRYKTLGCLICFVLLGLGGYSQAGNSSNAVAAQQSSLDHFRLFVTDSQSANYYSKWVSQNPGETTRWTIYRNAILAGLSPSPPIMNTHYGSGLVDGGILYLDSLISPGTTTSSTIQTTQTTTPSTTTIPAPSGPIWGMAGSYTSAQLSDLSARNIKLGMVEMNWASAEPQSGVWDEAYFQSVRDQINTMRSLGFRIILNYGMHHAPSWLLVMPNARFVNQLGVSYTGSDEANLVFAKSLRSYAEIFTSKVFSELGTDFYAVRVGGGHFGELQYPGQKDSAGKWQWWAFDADAKAQSPTPGYIPCSGTSTQAGTFLTWYLDAISNFQNWQIATVRSSYSGPIAVLYASWGMRSGDFDKAVADNLCGNSSAEINGEVQRGFDPARHISALTDNNAAVWGTWAENAGTISYLSGLATVKGLKIMEENAGQDTPAQMQTTITAAKQYGVTSLLWIRAADAYCFCSGYATIDDYTQLTK